MADTQEAIDIGHIALGELRQASFPAAENWELFRVHFPSEVHAAILKHAVEDEEVELCGVLVGEVCKDEKGPFLTICGAIRGEHASHQAAQVTFTQETWAHIHRELDLLYPDKRIVGWYHTHPGFGAFLSRMDLFIHENFFNLPWQVAFVIDPRSGEEGAFCWKKGKVERMRHYWVGQEERASLEGVTAGAGDLAKKVRDLETGLEAFQNHFRRRLRDLSWSLIAVVIVFGLMLLWLFTLPSVRESGWNRIHFFWSTHQGGSDAGRQDSDQLGRSQSPGG
ncbi:MAG: Mov34/MPN/PAD-1 family protein [Candidatus Sumerlaeota bacterium]|nr:Mov34/MPN/PAD-1 family protein [Candidatus Sumerlaeota bacterium]